jgi:dihydrofolate reductase
MIRLIAAQDPNGIIGIDGNIPWHNKADFKRFKNVTMGSTLVMGRTTWESLPKPLPGRRMVVLTRQHPDTFTSKHPAGSCDYVSSLESAYRLGATDPRFNGDVWIAGGGEVYKLALEGRKDVEEVDLTIVPAVDPLPVAGTKKVTYLPGNLLEGFRMVSETRNPEDSNLIHRTFVRT